MANLQLQAMIDDLLSGRANRRQFIQRAGALGLSVSVISAILAACGGDDDDDDSSDATGDTGSGTEESTEAVTEEATTEETEGSEEATEAASEEASETESEAEEGSSTGTLDQIVLGLGADARTLTPNTVVDATTDWQLENIFDPLLRRDAEDNFNIGPWLAELTAVDDLTWEVKLLRDDIVFHNGEPLTSEAIITALDYAKDPANETHYLSRWEPLAEYEALDDMTVQIKSKEPFPLMPTRVAEIYPVPPQYFADNDKDFVSQNPVGTGPFIFKEWVRDEHLTLTRNEEYWQGPVQVNELEFRYLPDFSSRLAALLSDELDLMKDVPVDSIERVNESGHSRAEEITSSRINYVALVTNREDSVFNNLKLRQALNYGVNVDAIIDGIFQGHATRMAGCISSVNPEVNTEIEPYPYDPDKAKQLIEEASQELGIDLSQHEITLDSPQGRYPMDSDAAQAIAAECGTLGLNVKVQYNEWGTHLDKIVNRRTGDMFYLGWGPALDAQSTIAELFVGDATYSGYNDPDLTTQIEEASQTADDAARQELWNQIQQTIYDDAGWLFLWLQHDIYGMSNDVAWQPRIDESLWMGDAAPREEG